MYQLPSIKHSKRSIKLILLFCALFVKSNAFATDQVKSQYGDFYHLGGIDNLCKDYETLIILESQRIKEKDGKSKPYYPNNDELSSVFRILGLSEKIGNDRLGKELEKCIK